MEFNDTNFLKTAALYWDKIYTIVPEAFQNPYIEKGSVEAESAGLLAPAYVTSDSEETKLASKEFFNDYQKQIIEAESLLPGGQSEKAQRESILVTDCKLHWERIHNIYLEKMSWELRDLLSKFIVKNDDSDNSSLIMPENLGQIYMSILASVIAESKNTVPITDYVCNNEVIINRYLDTLQERKENQAQLATLSIQTLAINPKVPLINILRFRDKHRQELINYRRQIRNLTRYICGELDTAQKQSLFEEITKDEIIPQIKDIEAKLISEENFFMIAHTVNTVVAIGTLILSGGQAWLSSFLQATASIGLNFYGNIRAERNIKDSSFGYLYKAQQEFGN